MVWPIMSGTIVERRDHVFTTFFSFRAFSPSTFSRRWPSMNGPFFSERGMRSPLFLDPAQLHPLRPAHFSKSANGTWHAMRHRAERANKPRSLGVRYLVHNYAPARAAQAEQHL